MRSPSTAQKASPRHNQRRPGQSSGGPGKPRVVNQLIKKRRNRLTDIGIKKKTYRYRRGNGIGKNQSGIWGWDPLGEETATLSSPLAWRIPRMEEPGARVRHSRATNTFTFMALKIQYSKHETDRQQRQGNIVTISWEKNQSRVRLLATTWTAAYQAPPPMEFSRQEYWSRLLFPSPGDLPDPGIEPRSPHIAGRCFTLWATTLKKIRDVGMWDC